RLRGLGRRDMVELFRVLPISIQDLLDDEFEHPALKALVAAGAVRDLRQGPRSGGTAFNLLHYLAGAPSGSVRARDYWRAAPDAFVHAAEQLARERGVTIRTGAAVARINVHDDAVRGVALESGEEIEASTVISTADPGPTLLGMVDPVWLDPELLLALRNVKYRGSTALIMYGLTALPETRPVSD